MKANAMTDTNHFPTGTGGNQMKATVRRAIESELGNIETLPPDVVRRVKEVYDAFIPIYVEMLRLEENRSADWHPEKPAVDPAVVDGLMHFFSDYQHIARRFQRVNRQVKHLLTLDPRKDARRFTQCASRIVSEPQEESILSSLVHR
jgi:hypothetical protein